MSTARSSIRSRKSKRVNSDSPLAIGMSVDARTSRLTALVVGGDRLLQPADVAVRDGATEALGLGDRPGAVRVAHDADGLVEPLARRPHPPDRVVERAVASADPHLDRLEVAAIDEALQLGAMPSAGAQPPEA